MGVRMKKTELKRIKRRRYERLRILAWVMIMAVIFMLAGAAVIWGINLHMKGKYEDHILSEQEASELDADCILVLGAGVKENGNPSLMLRDRLEMGLVLYEQGVSGRLLMSGDPGREEYDEVNIMKNYALRLHAWAIHCRYLHFCVDIIYF